MKDPLNNAFSDAHFLCLEKGLPGNVENGGSTVKSIPWQHSMAWFPRGNPIAIPSFYPDIIPLRFHLKSPSIIHLLSISLHESMFADEIPILSDNYCIQDSHCELVSHSILIIPLDPTSIIPLSNSYSYQFQNWLSILIG